MLKRGLSTIGLSLVLVGLVGAAEGVDELVKQLKNKDEIVRFKAAKALGKLGAEAKDAIPALTEALKDKDEDVRAVAKRSLESIEVALASMTREGVVAELEKQVKAAKNKDKAVREAAALRLAKLLEDSDEIIRLKAARTLGEMGLDAIGAEKALKASVKDGDAAVRKMARKALDRLADAITEEEGARQRAELEPILKDLRAKDPKKRIKAMDKIMEMGPKATEAGQALVEGMMDKSPAIRNKAAEALEAIDPEIHRNVVTIFIGQQKNQALGAIAGMGVKGKAALPAVLYILSLPIPELHFSAMTAMLKIAPDDKRVARTIITLVSQGPVIAQGGVRGTVPDLYTRTVRSEAIRNLEKMDITTNEKVSALISALKDQSCIFQAIEALGRIGPDASAAIPVLRPLRNSTNDALRDAAAEAVRSIEK